MVTPIGLIHLTDVLDVLLVTALLYTALVWVRRTGAGFVAIGLLLLGALYVLAVAFDLRLTTWIFQGFLAIFLVMVVVIFQEELRQLFEQLAVWGLRRGRPPAATSTLPADVLVESLVDLARARIGALVVLPGRQPIGRHVRGGIELDGRVSVPLLKSIFDPHSPGHDGAVVVEGDRITRFATHLPLSTDLRQTAGSGTRHSAALGLAELTDALCLVVSEERGTISVARDGRLRRVPDAAALAGELVAFRAATVPQERQRSFARQLLLENWVEKLASLLIVMGLWWGLVPGSRPDVRTYAVPVRVTDLAEGLELESVEPPEVEVTLSGLRRDFYLFNPRSLEVVIDASLARLGRRTFRIADADLRHPSELSVQTVEPDAVRLSVRAAPPATTEPAS